MEIPGGDPGRRPGVEVSQKLKQFVDIVYMFSLQKRSKKSRTAKSEFLILLLDWRPDT